MNCYVLYTNWFMIPIRILYNVFHLAIVNRGVFTIRITLIIFITCFYVHRNVL